MSKSSAKKSQNAATGAPLPMPYVSSKRLSRDEWNEYRRRRAQHLERFPDYDVGWNRPTLDTANRVWTLLTTVRPKLRISSLLPDYLWLEPDEAEVIADRAKQALAVAVDSAIVAGETGRMFTYNSAFDALAARWSDNYRAAREAGPATSSWQMRPETLQGSWRDLLRNGIRFDGLLREVHKGFPELYTTARIPGRGYTITLDEDSQIFADYVSAIETPGGYQRRTTQPRLIFAGESLTPPTPDQTSDDDTGAYRVAGEWTYNVARSGQRSGDVIRQLRQARLFLHVPAFMDDYEQIASTARGFREQLMREHNVDPALSNAQPRGTATGKPRSPRQWAMRHLTSADAPTVKSLVEQYDTAKGHLSQLKGVRKRLLEAKADEIGDVEIKSDFYKLSNRRYQAAHFWPTEVTGKASRREVFAEAEPSQQDGTWLTLGRQKIWLTTSRRGRWFKAAATGLEDKYPEFVDDFAGDRRPLVGVDVSGSQLQILAVFLGLTGLERLLTEHSFKNIAAETAKERDGQQRDPFKLPRGHDDATLKAAVKQAAMTHLYGSELTDVAHKLRQSLSEYGPGLGDAENIKLLLNDPRLKLDGVLRWFLPACQTLAEIACERDRYAGAIFTDPFDGAAVRWNPVRLLTKRCAGKGEIKVYAKLPAGEPSMAGDYPVDRKKLRRAVAPCLTHMLDAAFAGLVVEKLNTLGVRDVVSVHDCWMVASDALPALSKTIEAAGEPWLRMLGPVYGDLETYLGSHEKYGPWVHRLREQWTARVGRQDWPRFRVDEADLVKLSR